MNEGHNKEQGAQKGTRVAKREKYLKNNKEHKMNEGHSKEKHKKIMIDMNWTQKETTD